MPEWSTRIIEARSRSYCSITATLILKVRFPSTFLSPDAFWASRTFPPSPRPLGSFSDQSQKSTSMIFINLFKNPLIQFFLLLFCLSWWLIKYFDTIYSQTRRSHRPASPRTCKNTPTPSPPHPFPTPRSNPKNPNHTKTQNLSCPLTKPAVV